MECCVQYKVLYIGGHFLGDACITGHNREFVFRANKEESLKSCNVSDYGIPAQEQFEKGNNVLNFSQIQNLVLAFMEVTR